MDRNYFLSYGYKTALLLLLLVLGKLNATSISMVKSSAEISIDVANSYLSSSSIATFTRSSAREIKAVGNVKKINTFLRTVRYEHHHNWESNGPFTGHEEVLIVSSEPEIKWFEIWRNYMPFAPDFLSSLKVSRKFDTNSCKLIDGFKFIIKIPDKLFTLSI